VVLESSRLSDNTRGKCTAKRRRIIWGKKGTNNVENGRRIQRKRRRKYT